MSRNLARRGASVLVAAAVLGGGLAFGGGTASAAEPDPIISGSVDEVIRVILVDFFGPVVRSGSAAVGNTEPCHGVSDNPEPDGLGCFGVLRVLPDEIFES